MNRDEKINIAASYHQHLYTSFDLKVEYRFLYNQYLITMNKEKADEFLDNLLIDVREEIINSMLIDELLISRDKKINGILDEN
tara:strand:+ start:163013 stop:163261 length:249 start_codon:yes stop_codon:yes gene_type:complete